jgi:hypothetical protein
VTGAAKATWSTDMFECCASPGGCRRCESRAASIDAVRWRAVVALRLLTEAGSLQRRVTLHAWWNAGCYVTWCVHCAAGDVAKVRDALTLPRLSIDGVVDGRVGVRPTTAVAAAGRSRLVLHRLLPCARAGLPLLCVVCHKVRADHGRRRCVSLA